MRCPKRQELQQQASAALQQIIELTKKLITAVQENDQSVLLALDKHLETTFGEKERAFGALREHTKEHGCLL